MYLVRTIDLPRRVVSFRVPVILSNAHDVPIIHQLVIVHLGTLVTVQSPLFHEVYKILL